MYLSDNQLKNLPETIGNLTNLTHLYLSDNQLKNLPEIIGNLTNLIVLDLKNNQLTNLPKQIKVIENIRELDLRENKLINLAESIGFLQSLTQLNGITIPEQYQGIKLELWSAIWLLNTNNTELRKLFIEIIGYRKICEELEVLELDKWREYTLLKVDREVDIETINLLKMECPSTNSIHILRVPPNLTSAREAIKWVNWDIDPEYFAIET